MRYNFYRQLYDDAPAMPASFEPDIPALIRCNRTVTEKPCYSEAVLIGKKLLELCHQDSQAEIEQLLKSDHSADGNINKELLMHSKDGTRLYAGLNLSTVRDKGGSTTLCGRIF